MPRHYNTQPYVYIASSWRNPKQPEVVERLRGWSADIYDFRNPTPGAGGFHWSDIDPDWKDWTPTKFADALYNPIAKAGFRSDMNALQAADAVVLVMPCGRSAHLELGVAVGMGKPTAILLADGEPELMYAMVDVVTDDVEKIAHWLDKDVRAKLLRDRGLPR